ncbi:EAL domain-containing protein [Nostoc sp. UHCC 0302]|uniref:EAL domain-containing protein n=1 Tax=Nostoc sp. UHCC 0302 TaxID=3134896 RepID=UPI00311CDB60
MLSERESKHHSLMPNKEKVVFFQTNPSGVWTFLNPAWTEITGFTLAESIGKSFLSYVHPDDRQRNLNLFHILSQGQTEDYLFETRYLTKDGGCCSLEVYFRITLDREGQFIGTSGTLKKISDCAARFISDDSPKRETLRDRTVKENKPSKYVKKIAFSSSDYATRSAGSNRYLEVLVEVEHSLLNLDGSIEKYIEILQSLGQACRASRAYICKNCDYDYGGLKFTLKAEWCAKGIQLPIDNHPWQSLSHSECFSNWAKRLARGNIVSSIVAELSASERNILERQGILAILILPIIAKGQFWGFIGFDNCVESQPWGAKEVAFLQAAAGALSLKYERLLVEDELQTEIVETQNFASQLENSVQERTAQLQREIAGRKLIQAELEKLLSLQQATLKSAANGILVMDSKGNITDFNQKFVEMWGIPESLMKLGNYRQALLVAVRQLENPKKYLAAIKEICFNPDAQISNVIAQGESGLRTGFLPQATGIAGPKAIALKDGRIFEYYSQSQRLGGKIWIFSDVTDHKFAAAKLCYQVSHDLLTNLLNRDFFHEYLCESLAKAHQNGSKLAVCFLDLDRFKTINNTLGHTVGDKLLQSVAQRLKKCLRPGDTIARWGGDEFIILLPEIHNLNDVVQIQEQILETLKAVFDIENYQLHISASIGTALYPIHGEDAETLIKHADATLYRVKSQGRNNYQFYNSTINSQASELLKLENSLHYALERQEFKIYYQPQVNINTGEIPKMEALLRWQHPELGLIPPEKFIPIAEETGLIIPIGEWVLRTACAQNKAWQEAFGLPSLSVAVNISPRQFQQTNFVNMVKQILSETKLQNQCLELEITESIAMQNTAFSKKILRELYNMGVSISIDDFGTGYCSLSYLKNFPIHTLKIDRSFVRDLTTDTSNAAITTAIVALAHGLNLTVVAEGVETEEQRNLLRVIECELMQGHLFSCAVSAEDATILLLKKCKFRRVITSFLVA